LAAAIAARRDLTELSDTMVLLTQIEDLAIRQTCWEGLRSAFSGPTQVSLTDHAVLALKATAAHEDSQLAAAGQSLIQLLRVETEEDRALRIEQALNAIGNIQTPVEVRLAAVSEVAAEQDAQVTDSLLAAVGNSTPQVREAILNAVFSRQERLASVLAAIESKTLPASALSGVQRASLLDHRDAKLRERASQQFATLDANHEQALAHYAAALHGERNAARGAQLFRQKCGTCHQAHGVGVAVGPDLSAESKRAEETILRDIIAPSSSITAGYVTYSVSTTEGQVFTGLLAAESASSVTLKLPEGKVKTVLRKEIEEIKASSASMMPEDLIKTLSPREVADILAWLRAPDAHAVTTARSANDKPPGK